MPFRWMSFAPDGRVPAVASTCVLSACVAEKPPGTTSSTGILMLRCALRCHGRTRVNLEISELVCQIEERPAEHPLPEHHAFAASLECRVSTAFCGCAQVADDKGIRG
ncbi:unnamed protein product [Effrenium voratum]|nr:unnamed protein product [Effrenium voratum]